jgi:glycosyltransferase involved in cell wall biosynthesis
VAPTLPARAGSGRADGGNGVTIGRIGGVIERECGLEMILASPRDLPPPAASFDEVGDLEQYLDAADVAVVGVLHAFKCGDVLDQLAEIKRRRGEDFVPTVLVLGGTDVNVDAGDKADVLTRRAHAVDKVVSFSASMITAAPAGSLPSDGRTRVVPQGVNLPTDEEPVHSTDGDAEDANAPAPPPPPLPLHEACGVPSTTPVFLLPAGLRPVKDVLWAIDAIDSIGASSNSDPFVLAILGPSLDDEYRDTVIERLKTSKHAVLIPPVDRAHTVGYIRAASAVVNTSKSEGQSGAILEAAAAGVPIIARDIPGNRTLLELLFDATGTEKGGEECDLGEFESSHPEGFESHPCGVLCPTPESFAAALASSAAGRERRSTDRAALGAECLARGERDGWRDIIREVIGERPEGGCEPPDVA